MSSRTTLGQRLRYRFDNIMARGAGSMVLDKALNAVFKDMFDPEGSQIYLRPAGEYVRTGSPVTFATVVEAARRRNQTAIGFKIAGEAHEPQSSFGVFTNPGKALEISFTPHDKVIVMAED